MATPPEPGSLQEALCILIFNYREEAEIMRLAVEKTGADSKALEAAFDNYMSAKVPYIERSKGQQSKTADEVLTKIFENGPMVINRGNKE